MDVWIISDTHFGHLASCEFFADDETSPTELPNWLTEYCIHKCGYDTRFANTNVSNIVYGKKLYKELTKTHK